MPIYGPTRYFNVAGGAGGAKSIVFVDDLPAPASARIDVVYLRRSDRTLWIRIEVPVAAVPAVAGSITTAELIPVTGEYLGNLDSDPDLDRAWDAPRYYRRNSDGIIRYTASLATPSTSTIAKEALDDTSNGNWLGVRTTDPPRPSERAYYYNSVANEFRWHNTGLNFDWTRTGIAATVSLVEDVVYWFGPASGLNDDVDRAAHHVAGSEDVDTQAEVIDALDGFSIPDDSFGFYFDSDDNEVYLIETFTAGTPATDGAWGNAPNGVANVGGVDTAVWLGSEGPAVGGAVAGVGIDLDDPPHTDAEVLNYLSTLGAQYVVGDNIFYERLSVERISIPEIVDGGSLGNFRWGGVLTADPPANSAYYLQIYYNSATQRFRQSGQGGSWGSLDSIGNFGIFFPDSPNVSRWIGASSGLQPFAVIDGSADVDTEEELLDFLETLDRLSTIDYFYYDSVDNEVYLLGVYAPDELGRVPALVRNIAEIPATTRPEIVQAAIGEFITGDEVSLNDDVVDVTETGVPTLVETNYRKLFVDYYTPRAWIGHRHVDAATPATATFNRFVDADYRGEHTSHPSNPQADESYYNTDSHHWFRAVPYVNVHRWIQTDVRNSVSSRARWLGEHPDDGAAAATIQDFDQTLYDYYFFNSGTGHVEVFERDSYTDPIGEQVSYDPEVISSPSGVGGAISGPPVPVNEGGTGATTPAGARANLGAIALAEALTAVMAGTGINVNRSTAGEIVISATDAGGSDDGVVDQGVFDEGTQIVTLTTTLGGTVTINLSAFITADELVAAFADRSNYPTATQSQFGVVRFATNAQAQAGTSTGRAVTPANLPGVIGTYITDNALNIGSPGSDSVGTAPSRQTVSEAIAAARAYAVAQDLANDYVRPGSNGLLRLPTLADVGRLAVEHDVVLIGEQYVVNVDDSDLVVNWRNYDEHADNLFDGEFNSFDSLPAAASNGRSAYVRFGITQGWYQRNNDAWGRWIGPENWIGRKESEEAASHAVAHLTHSQASNDPRIAYFGSEIHEMILPYTAADAGDLAYRWGVPTDVLDLQARMRRLENKTNIVTMAQPPAHVYWGLGQSGRLGPAPQNQGAYVGATLTSFPLVFKNNDPDETFFGGEDIPNLILDESQYDDNRDNQNNAYWRNHQVFRPTDGVWEAKAWTYLNGSPTQLSDTAIFLRKITSGADDIVVAEIGSASTFGVVVDEKVINGSFKLDAPYVSTDGSDQFYVWMESTHVQIADAVRVFCVWRRLGDR